MLAPLLMTIASLVTSPGVQSAPTPGPGQGTVVEYTAQEDAALTVFNQSVRDYMALHRRLARRTPPLRVTSDPAEFLDAIDQLSEAIRLERHGVPAGDVFTPAVASMFRRRIHRALWDFDVTELMADMEEDAEPSAPKPAVNGRFPWMSGNAMWPSVLAALPELPAELEYRFVGADLVLIDIRANLVVDILEGALTSSS
jgi:hypothetical protein